MIRVLYAYISTPSAYIAQPVRHALNQAGHVLIGAVLAWLLGPWFLVGLVGYIALIELPQYLLWDGSFWDGVEDTTHVFCGMMAVVLSPWVLLLSVWAIGVGTAIRCWQFLWED